jgi:hypothetical protein
VWTDLEFCDFSSFRIFADSNFDKFSNKLMISTKMWTFQVDFRNSYSWKYKHHCEIAKQNIVNSFVDHLLFIFLLSKISKLWGLKIPKFWRSQNPVNAALAWPPGL